MTWVGFWLGLRLRLCLGLDLMLCFYLKIDRNGQNPENKKVVRIIAIVVLYCIVFQEVAYIFRYMAKGKGPHSPNLLSLSPGPIAIVVLAMIIDLGKSHRKKSRRARINSSNSSALSSHELFSSRGNKCKLTN